MLYNSSLVINYTAHFLFVCKYVAATLWCVGSNADRHAVVKYIGYCNVFIFKLMKLREK